MFFSFLLSLSLCIVHVTLVCPFHSLLVLFFFAFLSLSLSLTLRFVFNYYPFAFSSNLSFLTFSLYGQLTYRAYSKRFNF